MSNADSWQVAEMLQRTHDDMLAAIPIDVEDHLRALRPLRKQYLHPGTPLVTTVELVDVRPSRVEIGPTRRGSLSAPGFSGYSPAGVFARNVRKALNKASQRQAVGVPAAARALVVNLTHMKIAEDLTHPAHMAGAKAALEGVSPSEFDLDVIAFVVRVRPEGLAAMLMVVEDDGAMTVPTAQALFGQQS